MNIYIVRRWETYIVIAADENECLVLIKNEITHIPDDDILSDIRASICLKLSDDEPQTASLLDVIVT